MAAEAGAIITFIFNGEEDIPRDITHLIIHENITVIPAWLFCKHPNLAEVYCHAGVVKIEAAAFYCCLSLQRVIIPGVTIIEESAFYNCTNLVHVECNKLETVGDSAFSCCESLSSINLQSVKVVERRAFSYCRAMTQAIFGKDLQLVGERAFMNCSSLESITIPLKNGLFTNHDVFKGCNNLERVYLVEGEALRDLADALLFEDWKKDMNDVIDSINEVMTNADPGDERLHRRSNEGGKARAIRDWIGSVLRKVTHYKTTHCELLSDAAATLQLSLPNDTVMNNVLPFVELPVHTLDGENEAEH